MPNALPSAVVFDLDGTLIDSVSDITATANRLLTERGGRALAETEVRDMVGDGATDLVRRAFAAADLELPAGRVAEAVARYLDIYAEHRSSPACLYPGVVDTLEALAAAGVRLGLCTNKAERVTRPLLEGLDLARFFGEAVFGGGVLPVLKPDPAPLLWVLERLGAPEPARSVMVGDSRNDALSARAANMPVVLVSYGYSKIPAAGLGADVVIDHFHELPGALGGLAA